MSPIAVLFPYGALAFPPQVTKPTTTATGSTTRIHMSAYSKWDNLVDNDEDEGDDKFESRDASVPADMKYVIPNIKRQSDTFDALESMGDAELIRDVWLQSPADSTAWFVGRVARVSDVSIERCIDRQYPLIERHSWTLRPIDLHPRRGPFIVYYAPGNTEEFAAAGDPSVSLTRVEEGDVRNGSAVPVKTIEVGFKGAAYDDVNEDSFKIDLRNSDHDVDDEENEIDPDLNGFAIPATPEENEKMQAMANKLETKDIDKFFDDDDWKNFVDESFPTDSR